MRVKKKDDIKGELLFVSSVLLPLQVTFLGRKIYFLIEAEH